MFLAAMTGCSLPDQDTRQKQNMKDWEEMAELSAAESPEELYQKALQEDMLVVYSVSSRTFEAKESFEKDYQGLTVEVKDVRGDDIVNMLLENYQKENYACDVVICSDCDGSLTKELVEPGIVYTYIPQDIKPFMREGHADRELDFIGEAIMLCYNTVQFDRQPIQNIWELTEEQYRGKIIMANPLSSFSTYGFCSTLCNESEQIAEAYLRYTGIELAIEDGKNAGEMFWEKVSDNIVFTNSSDEVVEGIGGQGSGNMSIGIMISSKMRYQDLGYHFAPIYHLEPFAAVYTPNSVTIAGGSRSVNTAKLFVRYLLGEADGTGMGIKPYSTKGTWSVRKDVADGNLVPLDEMDMVRMDKEHLYRNRDHMIAFWKQILKETSVQ